MVDQLLQGVRGGLIVSCQAYPGEAMRHSETMAQMAEAAVLGGAVAIRAQGLADISLISERVSVPQIGLWKVGAEGVFITPTLEHARAVTMAGAQIVAIDGTRRPRLDGLTLAQTVRRIQDETGALVMADAGSLADGLAAEEAGADIIGTTLAGYTAERAKTDGPDFELLAQLASAVEVPVVAEGRIYTPSHAAEAIALGAFAVVVGTAITHPTTITSWFAKALTR